MCEVRSWLIYSAAFAAGFDGAIALGFAGDFVVVPTAVGLDSELGLVGAFTLGAPGFLALGFLSAAFLTGALRGALDF